MKAETIFEALAHTPDEYLDSAHLAMERGKRRMGLRRSLLMAACITLAVAMVALPIGMMLAPDEPLADYPLREFSAREINGIFNAQMMGVPTNQYSTIEVSSADDLDFAPLPDSEYLLIYENFAKGKPIDKDELDQFTKFCYTQFSKAAGEKAPAYTIDEYNSTFTPFPEDAFGDADHLFTKQDQFNNRFSYGCNDSSRKGLYLNGKQVYVDQTKSDEEIKKSIQWVRKLLCDIFDESFTDTSISRIYGDQHEYGVEYLQITFYNADPQTSDLPELSTSTHCIQLTFENYSNYKGEVLSKDKLIEVDIDYVQPRHPYRGATAKAKMISLERAEELLSKGYVFGGHGCPLCMSKQDPVDFTDYDAVKLTYIFTQDTTKSNPGIGIPFYAFYKYIGEAKNGNLTYACTYVPAIEVNGLDEYFQNQFAHHNS